MTDYGRACSPSAVFRWRALAGGGGSARGATAVALAPATLLVLRKWAYDAALRAIQIAAAADVTAFLRSTDLFPRDKVSDADLKVLALRLETLTAAPGVQIVAANDLGKGVFFIRFGRAGVSSRTQTVMSAAEAMTGLEEEAEASGFGSPIDAWRSPLRAGSGRGGGIRPGPRPAADRIKTVDVPLVGRCSFTPASPRLDRAWIQRSKLKSDETLSNFAFDLKLRRYTSGELVAPAVFGEECLAGGVLRTCTRSTLNRRTKCSRLYEHSP